jgi:hypothetical protein
MRPRIIFAVVASLIAVVFVSCGASEISWANKRTATDSTRELVALPSIAIGNLSPAARNPGLEVFCTGLYDTPGGYCSYFTDGVPFTGFSSSGNITVSDGNT